MKLQALTVLVSNVLVVALSAPVASAEERVAFDAANAPFMFDKDNTASGLYPALFAETFKRMNVPVKMEAVPWKRAISCIDSGECGVGGIYQNSERIAKYDYSKSFFEEKLVVYVLASKPFAFNGLSDLNGKTVGVLRGWSYGDDFDKAVAEKKITRDDVTSDDVNLQKLLAGHVDAIVCVAESGSAALKKANLGSQIKAMPTPLAINKVYLAFNKNAHKTEILAAFDKAMEKMRADGSFQSLVAKGLAP